MDLRKDLPDTKANFLETDPVRKRSMWDQARMFSNELLSLLDREAIRESVCRSVHAIFSVESAKLFFSSDESDDIAVVAAFVRSPENESASLGVRSWMGSARGRVGVQAVLSLSEKTDWSEFSHEEIALLESITVQVGLRLENIRLERELVRHQASSVQALAAAIEVKDRYTAGHTKRVGVYADAVVDHLPISDTDKENIRLAGVLHDIGKIGVPDRILLKPGNLTSEEWDEMRLHTEAGFDIVSRVAGLEEIAEILRHHHERWDGSGYPRGLRGEAIPFASRVIAIADTFDAIVTDRPYRAAKSPVEAKEIIQGLAGTYFQESIVAAFLVAFPRLESLVLEDRRVIAVSRCV